MGEATSGVILAGGGSRRMGRDKALLEIDGEKLIVRVARQLRPHVDELLISADNAAAYAFTGYPVVPDREIDQGPLCALATCLQHARHERLLITSCDVPDLPPALIEALLSAADAEVEAALLRSADGRLQPLLACYRRSALPAIEAALAAGKRRADAFLEAITVREVLWKERLWNLNTPAQLEAYLAANAQRGARLDS